MNPWVLAVDLVLCWQVKMGFLGYICGHCSIPSLNYLLFSASSFKAPSVYQLATH